ncbi:unnamed protein product, partial [Sphagnum jensenii]
LFQQMERECMTPSTFTFVTVLKACAKLGLLQEGKRIHTQILQKGCESDIFVSTSLVGMYTKCGSLEDACKVFDRMSSHDVVSWTAMISGHVKHGQAQKALELYHQMEEEEAQMERECMTPSTFTFVTVLKACAKLGLLQEGKRIHTQILQKGCESDIFVSTSLVGMYTKCGSLEDARKVFDRMSSHDVVSWTAMISGHVKHGSLEEAQRVFNRMPRHNVVSWNAMILGHVKSQQAQQALELYKRMQSEGVQPDSVTFVGVLNACASVMGLEEGRLAHKQIIQSNCESNVFVVSSLVDMYAKCGSLEDAQKVFNRMPRHNVGSWNAMILGHVKCGQGQEALELYQKMQGEEGVQPDPVTFVGVLNASCSHGGLVCEGLLYFESMGSVYGISATVEHCACMVDLLGRAGHLQEAEDFINTMSCEPNGS